MTFSMLKPTLHWVVHPYDIHTLRASYEHVFWCYAGKEMPKGISISFELLGGLIHSPGVLLCPVAVAPSTGGWRLGALRKNLIRNT